MMLDRRGEDAGPGRKGGGEAWELTWRPRESSHTFHGRDVMGPVAGMLICGKGPAELGRPVADVLLLDVRPAGTGERSGAVIHIDQFGNATTNMEAKAVVGARVEVTVGGVEDEQARKQDRRENLPSAPGVGLQLGRLAARDDEVDCELQVGAATVACLVSCEI